MGKLYKKERRVDGLAQAIGSGPGPGTRSPPVNGFALYSLQPRQSKRWISSVFFNVFFFFCILFFLLTFVFCVCVNVYVHVCGPKLKFHMSTVEITEVLFQAFFVCSLPLIWSLCTQTIRCWGSGLCLAPGSTLILATLLFWGIMVSAPLV